MIIQKHAYTVVYNTKTQKIIQNFDKIVVSNQIRSYKFYLQEHIRYYKILNTKKAISYKLLRTGKNLDIGFITRQLDKGIEME